MTISELIKALQSREDEFGDLPVERSDGTEVIGVAAVFKLGVKDPNVIAVTVK